MLTELIEIKKDEITSNLICQIKDITTTRAIGEDKMSLLSKVEKLKNNALADLNKKANEVRELNKNLDNFITLAKKELSAETEVLEKKKRELARDEQSFDNYKNKTENNLEKLRQNIERRIDSHINDVIEYFEDLEVYGKDPRIIDAYINACFSLDEKLAKYFENKPRPALDTASTIRWYKRENKQYLQRIQNLEYQLSELWAKDEDTSEKEDFELIDDDDERVKYFLAKEEYESLSESEKNQRALDNYLKKRHSKSHIGKMYERYIGYQYETQGYDVQYRGIEMGLKDGGIDLICRKGGEILLVQCKNWSLDSTIYEKHICQLYGASRFYDKDRIQEEYQEGLFADLDWDRVTPVFVATTQLDDHAIEVAKVLGVVVKNIPFDKTYPIIKCNVNGTDKIYHLPIDQMYDRTKICKPGEYYASSIFEAEQKGFRRAHRWMGNLK